MSDSDIGAKPPQSGLVDMGDISFYNDPSNPIPQFTLSDLNNYPQSFSEIVLNVTWAQLQPIPNSPGGTIEILDTSAITTAINQLNAYNSANHMLMGGALALTGSGSDLVVGENAGASGTVLDLEQIDANGNVVVGAAGSGTLHVMGEAAILSDAGAEVGASSGGQGVVDVDGGEWATSGTLAVGNLGTGTVRIGGVANGVAGQVTAYDVGIGDGIGSVGSVMGVAQLHEQGATARSVLRRHAGQFDLVYLHRVDNAARYGRLARQCFNAQIIYSVADLHHVRLQEQCKLERDPARAQELRDACAVIALREIAAAIAADDVITHSIAEAEQLRQIPRLAQAKKVHVIPWSIPVRPVSTPFAPRAGIAFVGGFKHAPNVDAARWFVDEVLPTVRQMAPEIECLLVGSDLTDELRRDLTRAGVTILGQIKNLDEIFESVRLTVAPLRFGAGLKDKVLRSLAAGLPCVGTTEAFRGMVDLPCAVTHMCIADTPSELAAAIVQMHRDEVANTRCAAAGLEYVRANYNKSRIDALTRALVRPALERHRNGSDAARSTSTVLSFADAVSKQIDGVNHFDAMRSRRLVFGRAQ